MHGLVRDPIPREGVRKLLRERQQEIHDGVPEQTSSVWGGILLKLEVEFILDRLRQYCLHAHASDVHQQICCPLLVEELEMAFIRLRQSSFIFPLLMCEAKPARVDLI